MNRNLIALATASLVTSMNTRAEPPGALTPELLADLRDGYEMDAGDRARHNAVTNAEINKLALNREIVAGEDGHFSHKIKTKGITNQKSSGRCWMFAGFNVMRPKVINELGLDGFEFSNAYLQFWDKMEKSNLYLEDIIELRDVDRLDREWLLVNEWLVGDGGWWNYVTGLISKYGAVPSSVMPETHSSENTSTMNKVLARLLHSQAAALIKAGEAGSGEKALRAMKEKSLKEIYRFLAINLGEPPTEFEWRYKAKSKDEKEDETVEVADKNLTSARSYTPQSFYKKFVGVPLKDYVCLYNNPQSEFNKHYKYARSRNMVGKENMNFVNIPIHSMKKIAVASILANEPLWFAANVGIDQSKNLGLMQHQLYDYESLFDIDLTLSKADRTRFHLGAANHAMVLMGVDLTDGKPRKWLVENSWGDKKGKKGTWTLYDSWFDQHVYNIIVHKRHVPDKVMARFKDKPRELPSWYPGAREN